MRQEAPAVEEGSSTGGLNPSDYVCVTFCPFLPGSRGPCYVSFKLQFENLVLDSELTPLTCVFRDKPLPVQALHSRRLG